MKKPRASTLRRVTDRAHREAIRKSLRVALSRTYDLGRGRSLELRIGRPVRMPEGEWGAACSIAGVPGARDFLIFQIDPITAVLQAIELARLVVPDYVGSALPRLQREWGDDLALALLKVPTRRARIARAKKRTRRT